VKTSSDKPYRVYRQPRRLRGGSGEIPWGGLSTSSKSGSKGTRRSLPKFKRARKWLLRGLIVFIALALVWGTIAYFAFRSALAERNELVPAAARKALSPADGPVIATPHNILLIGTDSRGKNDPGRADSLMLMRIDVKGRAISRLSIPRDLYTEVPGFGTEKVNSAYSNGGEALTIKTVRRLTGVPIHHYVKVDFAGFKKVVDALGGVNVDNPNAIRSARFDGRAWRFGKGKLHLDGRRALAYARVRKNTLDPSDSDLTRVQRQQLVIDGISDKLVSFNTLWHPRRAADAVVQPIVTELSASELLSMGIGKFWANDKNKLSCRLGGTLGWRNGQSVILGDVANRATVRMWQGKQNPVRPNIAVDQYAPGCVRG
jgi:LCP family protein required for cell wall assembly